MRKNKGSILITSLWIVTLLSLLAMGLGFRASLEVRLAGYNLDSLRARYLAKAGIIKAKTYLARSNKSYDSLYECGIELNEESPEDIFKEKIGRGSFSVRYRQETKVRGKKFTYGLVDEERKININLSKLRVDKAEFRKILKRLSPDFTEEIINAIIDWQDSDSEVTLPGGAEDSFYGFLENPYECSDEDFKSLPELLLVKGFSLQLFREVKDYLTVYGEGKINLNTASQKVLDAVINDSAQNFTTLVEEIVRYRKGTDGQPATPDDNYFTNLEEVESLAESNEEISRLNSLRNHFVFKSNNFRVISEGKINKLSKQISCILKKEPHSRILKVVYYHED